MALDCTSYVQEEPFIILVGDELYVAKLIIGIDHGLVLEIVLCSLCPFLCHQVLEKLLCWSEFGHGIFCLIASFIEMVH